MTGEMREARIRLAYINQHRELMLAGLLGAAVAGRLLLRLAIPLPVLAVLAVWFGVSIAFVQVGRRLDNDLHLERWEFGYFLFEVLLLTVLAHYAGGADWLAILFYSATVLYANILLPPTRGRRITWFAAFCYSGLVWLEYHGWLSHVEMFDGLNRRHASDYVLATVIVGGTLAIFLISYTAAQFSLMLTRKAEQLELANRDLRHATAALRQHQNSLEDVVHQRTSDLAGAYEELRRANQELRRVNEMKTNFLANVSHELRTPLTSIRSFSEILLNYPDEDLATRIEFLGIIKNESERLTRLINDVLDLTKIEAGRLPWDFRLVAAEDLVHAAAEVVKGWAERRGIDLRVVVEPNLPLLRADGDRLLQVLGNLINNALKFTVTGYIQVGALRRQQEVVLFVADSGPGIGPEEHDAIFEKFYQGGGSLVGKPEGTGLGLAICREILQNHGGRIWVESRRGQGSTFYCALPVVLSDRVRSSPDLPPPAMEGTQKKWLS